MRVLHVVGSFFPASYYGGPIETTRQLCSKLSALGHEVLVITTNANGRRKLAAPYRGWTELGLFRVFYGNRLFQPDVSLEMFRETRRWLARADVVHVTGTYNWYLPGIAKACLANRCPVVISPRGSLTLDARTHKGWKKRLYDALFQERALSRVSAIHATSAREKAEVITLRLAAPVVTIPNGVEIPSATVLPDRPEVTPYFLYLGRLDPYKQVERILCAFACVCENTVGPTDGGSRRANGGSGDSPIGLWIAGTGSPSYRQSLEGIAEQLGIQNRVRFLGHVDGAVKSKALTEALALVLASRSENFGMSVAEALAHGTPCVVTKTAPWQGLESGRCGLWVEDSEEALAAGMGRLLAISPEERRAMGERGRSWMQQKFSWDKVAREMLTLYEQLVEQKKSGS